MYKFKYLRLLLVDTISFTNYGSWQTTGITLLIITQGIYITNQETHSIHHYPTNK